MKKSPFELLVSEIDTLQKKYADQYKQEADLKALQGVERCLELKMKIMGFDGKTPPTIGIETPGAEFLLDLSKLSKQALQEI
ncbi:MAG: hypothetical protein RR465_03395, partial [Mucinivorans sp.]